MAAADFDHVKVAIRCKPLSEEEKRRVQVIIKTDGDKLIAFYPESKEGLLYNYDYFFPEETTQLDVFRVVGHEMVELCISGHNSCCIGYGASAAGKTHTLFGSDQEHGLIQMATKELFQRIDSHPSNISYDVIFTYWEMNNNEVRDALNIENTANLPIRKDAKKNMFIGGLSEVRVSCWEELDEWIMRGNITRIKLSEQRSARWHGFLKLHLTRYDSNDPDHVVTSTMMFGHLKGADRIGQKGASGDVLKHGSSINKSISLLGGCMLHVVEMRRRKLNEALVEADKDGSLDEATTQKKLQKVQKDLVKESKSLFAESKLTQVLTEPLSGACGTIILSTVSTTDYHETTDILENLQNAQQITVSLSRNVHTTEAGYIHKELKKFSGTVPVNTLAPGCPLTELEEQVRKLEDKYGHMVVGRERPDTPPVERPPPRPPVLPKGPKWKQSDVLANKHGDRATVYIPTASGKNTYKGQWAGHMKEGYGEQITKVAKYCGEWKYNMRDGEGTLWIRATEKDDWNRMYKGGWRGDKRHGFGTNWYPNGDIYEGYWADGKRSGIGKLYQVNGDKIEGQWRNDQTEGWASLYLQNGDWFEGHWHNGLREGPGVWYYESRAQIYRGEWHLGVAKCGTVEDMAHKTDSSWSAFLPRNQLVDPANVLEATRKDLKEQRHRIAVAVHDPYADDLDPDEIPDEAEFTGYDEEEYQKEIEEYIEVMDGPADRRAVAAGGYH
uniref:MORN repeat-containing protein 3 n=1 Tax=Eutreptiella gymnastica TaxID=73025 RepID=A0A7S1J5B3_9EUGL|mmetsp:Transcript_682/g.1359  ORF Transcript_682/g.1359 Transcript_682/m.1359 type:complete len:726 (+) Transcript_682:91-2268(+)